MEKQHRTFFKKSKRDRRYCEYRRESPYNLDYFLKGSAFFRFGSHIVVIADHLKLQVTAFINPEHLNVGLDWGFASSIDSKDSPV